MTANSLSSLYMQAWVKPDAGISGVLSRNPSESTLLSLVMISCFIQMLGNVGAILLYAKPAEQYKLTLASVVATLFFLPLAYFCFSWIIGKVCQSLGGRGTLFATRAALFWVLALVSPLIALSDVLPSHLYLSIPVGFVTAYMLSSSLTTVHKFSSRIKVFACLMILPVVVGIIAGLVQSEII